MAHLILLSHPYIPTPEIIIYAKKALVPTTAGATLAVEKMPNKTGIKKKKKNPIVKFHVGKLYLDNNCFTRCVSSKGALFSLLFYCGLGGVYY